MKIIPREIPAQQASALRQAGVHPLLAQLYAARGVCSADELDDTPARLLAPSGLLGMEAAVRLLADAIERGLRLCIVADYDCDGATACAVGWRGLRMLGATEVSYLVPDRVVDGYGLTPPIARRVKETGAEVMVTVDNGIASVEGVAEAKALGLQVVVTDHHLPGNHLPLADAIVNPNQPGCSFESKSMAGVGVMFYVLLALRAELRARGRFDKASQPRLEALLPLVALGTVADVVRLDANNRRLVALGLKQIRRGQMQPGLLALFEAAGRKAFAATTFDFGFALGPRINAAGRLSDMTIGIECLTTDDAGRAANLAQMLDAINRERRELEGGMREQALLMAEGLCEDGMTPPAAISVFDPDFHEGVVGIVASRIKDRMHRPSFVFAASGAPGHEHELKGSGRSIPGFHLRDALDLVSKRHPGLLLRFGGHAMAAGCTIAEAGFAVFEKALAQVAQEWLDAATLTRRIETDGPLDPDFRKPEMVEQLNLAVWGQGFAPPTFSEQLEVLSQRLVGEKHLKLQLRHQGETVDGIWFGHTDPLPPSACIAFRMDINEWRGERKVQFLIEGVHSDAS
ncbi:MULTISPECIES: single-stranded-DNA-specific exonuclease RecJ [Delftia]|jgi:single-stranded-DNA-specific exonuclease|uniref:Single-stranded-DNA-specific exonuclease RecJ n=1 Tax=Delftia acidovorans TaxID=80866 RepID=A0AAJ2QXJ3_DELAC|nr:MULTISPECIES: single-stranded-DNA-specific exonuclease RecJ [Delftia]EZP48323.1 Single-stranded-DNA-specific exonuclease RecJ [Delftia sp. RIT313]KZK25573.1 single-stranded-DNA-specific exonuclease RecJ [Delftia sp. GW456-R20]MBJ2141002.1 single-stranded-DNA-specific exonuclease RecJ [Delftia acidovorans]MBK0112568.1 single-stranded-DNA-specific exonuclease RecJ [Delftia sp. S65]MBK0117981.1 single-stranded-DNA-specific exonuclease RecJ [Delftia sp. S67]